MLRSLIALLTACLVLTAPAAAQGQVLHVQLNARNPASSWLVLEVAQGGAHVPVDSVRPDAQGACVFRASQGFPAGFYQLALHDTDRVDIILGPREPEVRLRFDGTPLQRHIQVLLSPENKLLWRYKAYSREHGATMEAVARERSALDPTAYRRLAQLDSIEQAAAALKQQRLNALIAEAPDSYFARVVRVNGALEAEARNGPYAVAKVFDFADPDLLRSSIYDKAVVTYLQSINVVSESQLTNASDTLIALASGNATCKAYMIEHLVDLFSTYGPQGTLQHIVDAYLAGPAPTIPLTPRLKAKVGALLSVSIGAIGPDVELADTLGGRTPLSHVLNGRRYGVLFFYSSTCDHCHLQMPGMARVHELYGPKGVQVMGVALDDDRKDFRFNLEIREIKYPCYSEFNGWGSSVAKAYEVKATPTIVLIDADRRIVAKPYDVTELEAELVRLLGQP